MACGFLGVQYKSMVLDYDDEKTPVQLMGKKMLPIVTFEDGSHSNESLDIIARLDTQKKLGSFNDLEQTNQWLDRIASPTHNLAMPYWVYTQEFNESSRKYFLKKKEAKRGPFGELIKKSNEFHKEINSVLNELDPLISPYFKNKSLSVKDIMIASHLWGLYIVPEFQFSQKMHQYLQNIKNKCQFNYHEDFWS